MMDLASVAGDFGDALDFIFNTREAQTGGVEVGGLAEVWEFTWEHLKISFAAMGLACAIAIPVGLALGHAGKGELLAVSISNVGRAVPSLALIAFFVAYIGVGFTNVMLALVLLAIPPILTNTYVGVRQVDREVIDAGKGMGLRPHQVIGRIEPGPLLHIRRHQDIRRERRRDCDDRAARRRADAGRLHPERQRLRTGRATGGSDARRGAGSRDRAGLRCHPACRRAARLAGEHIAGRLRPVAERPSPPKEEKSR
jgi:hypothetical protein